MIAIPLIGDWFDKIQPARYHDVVDRMNYYITTLALLFLAIMVSAKQYIGNPIQCWFPAQFQDSWREYGHDYCFIQNTYYMPTAQQVPQNVPLREKGMRFLGYYQWVPIVLALQAWLFYFPYFLWNSLNVYTGIDVNSLMDRVKKAVDVYHEKQEEDELEKIAMYLRHSLGLNSSFGRNKWRQNRYGCGLTCLYLFIKLLFLVNIVGQFYILNSFLGSEYTMWGFQIFYDLIRGKEWQVSGHFPRTTLCDFEIRADHVNIQRHTVQCVLMTNIFNEKIFIMLWFWLFFLGVVTAINFAFWLIVSLTPCLRSRYFLGHIEQSNKHDHRDRRAALLREVGRFEKKLPLDAVLVLRFVESNVGDWAANGLIQHFWKHFESAFPVIPYFQLPFQQPKPLTPQNKPASTQTRSTTKATIVEEKSACSDDSGCGFDVGEKGKGVGQEADGVVEKSLEPSRSTCVSFVDDTMPLLQDTTRPLLNEGDSQFGGNAEFSELPIPKPRLSKILARGLVQPYAVSKRDFHA